MRDVYVNGWRLLDAGERRRLLMLAFLIVGAGFAEIFALSSVSMLVPLLISPASVNKYAPLKGVIDWLGYADPRTAFLPLAIGASVLIMLSLSFSYFTFMASLRFGNEVARRIARESFTRCLHAPYAWHLRHSPTVLAQRCFNDPEKIGKGFFPAVLDQAYSVVLLLVGVIFLFLASPWQNLISIVVLGLIGGIIVVLLKPRISKASDAARDSTLELSRHSADSLSAVKDIQIKLSQPIFVSSFVRLFKAGNTALERVASLQKVSHTVLTAIGQIGIIAIAVVMITLNARVDEIAIQLALLLLVLSRVLPALSRTVASLNSLSTMRPYINGVHQLRTSLDSLPSTNPAADDRPAISPTWQHIEFDHVFYRYPGSHGSAIRDISIRFEKGKCYGLVGPSGAGKSTVSDIVLGLLDPTEGRFGLDGRNLKEFSTVSWLRRVGYVPQNPYIFNDTLRRNVAMGLADRDIDDTRVNRALKLADLDDVVAGLDKGLETVLGDRGSRLSGGQRQRLSIARALYQEPEILVLDEASSALDVISERKLRETINSLRGRLTILIVAHRLQVIAACDSIFLFKDGCLVDQGKFEELRASSPLFDEMVKSAQTG